MKKKSSKKKPKIRLSEIKPSKAGLFTVWQDVAQSYQRAKAHAAFRNFVKLTMSFLRLLVSIVVRKLIDWLFSNLQE